ncbi:hypothetical protein [Nocardia vulneris]|uniref:hypothetical protein n=1 Tax=Nocardia vulneris TaxID=1141657 RepID=UPI0005B85D10|nr:hypothetical protein [Nocardia vulneris]
MANFRLVMKRDALYKIRSEPGVRQDLERRGRAILGAAGGEAAGYMMSSRQGAKSPQGRWQVSVFAATAVAMRQNAQDNTLVRAFGAANG